MGRTPSGRAVIDLGAYGHNLRVTKRLLPPDCGIMAVVKANAYGHGAIPLARCAVAQGVSMLGVATIPEAVELRQAGIKAPIIVMVQTPRDLVGAAVEHDLRLMVSDVAVVERLGELARRANKVVSIHCKIDLGMGRQGFPLRTAESDTQYITRVSNVDIEGIATHFPLADRPGDSFTNGQIRSFKTLLKQLDRAGIPFEMVHAANSGAVLNYRTAAFDMVRPGLMTYGIWPSEPREDVDLRPVLRWETQVILVKELDAGTGIGYGLTYVAEHPMRIAILPVGYADGYKYGLGNKADVLIRGKRCPVRGTVSMDQIVVDVTDVPTVATGDTATLIGRDGEEEITATELADLAGTISYDIVAGIGRRVVRTYVE